jgi:hypothetical protein
MGGEELDRLLRTRGPEQFEGLHFRLPASPSKGERLQSGTFRDILPKLTLSNLI